MRFFRHIARLSYGAIPALIVVFAIPVAVFAQGAVGDVLRTPDNEVVSRGSFIHAAVEVLNMADRPVDEEAELPFRRVAPGLAHDVRIANADGTLEEVFGFDLLLARGITRGQALRILTGLTDLSSPRPVEFKDTPLGSSEEHAVRVAVERDWMQPLREDLFGVRRKLTGQQARLLLRKVRGEGSNARGADDPPQAEVRIQLQPRKFASVPKSKILEAVWGLINNDFLHEDRIDPDEAAYRAAEGIVESLGDEYTTFMRPVRSRNFQSQIQGEVSGIGARVEYVDSVLTIVTPIDGSPADRAGLQPGDQILSVNGESLLDIGFLEAVDKVRGPQGSKATLRIRRNGTELTVEVIRDTISVPEIAVDWHGNTAVIKVNQFGRRTDETIRSQLRDIMSKTPTGIVLDIRNNPGGLLGAAQTTVSNFVPEGTPVVEIRTRDGERIAKTRREPTVDTSVDVVVLINEGSASASEIVAGALQDHDRANLIGTKTFGKGTVQEVVQFNDQSGLKLTVAEWFTPGGRKIDGKGIEPDIAVEKENGRDAPLLKALDILR